MSEKDDLVQAVKTDFKEAYDGVNELYDIMIDDLNFIGGDQWPQDIKNQRQSVGQMRPCLTINKLPTFHDQVIGDQRQARPSIKVVPVDSKADPFTAKKIGGLIRSIEYRSNASIAYDTAFDSATAAGYGVFRIVTDYVNDESFDQEIKIRRVKNPFTAYPDPNAVEWCKEDGRYYFITELIPRAEYRQRWPNASPCEFDADKDKENAWSTSDTVRVAEYFYKVTENKMLYEIQYDGDEDTEDGPSPTFIVDELPPDDPPYQVIRERKLEPHKIMWCRTNGKEIIEGPKEWPGKYFPIIPVWGKELNIEGKTIYRGIVRHAKDPSRLYNYSRSNGAEAISLAPKVPFLATPKQLLGHEPSWKKADRVNFPFLLYNPDPDAKGPPQRQWPTQVSTGIQQETIIADQEIHDTTGLQQSSLGKASNEKSGKAIQLRQKEGDVGQFAYMSSYERSLTHSGKVIIDLIPAIYDAPRVEEILGEDGSTESVRFNETFDNEDGEKTIYDLQSGEYDVRVTIGPSYTTQRQEASESMMAFIAAFPDAAPIIGDLVAKNQDWPGAEMIEKRLQSLLPSGLLDVGEGEGQGPGSPGSPPPGAPAPPPDVNPEEMAMAETMIEIELETAEVKLAQEKADLRKKEAEAKMAELEVKQGVNP